MYIKRVISLKQINVIFISLFLLSFPSHEPLENDPLIVINNTLKEENIKIDQWEVVIKENLTKDQADVWLDQENITYTQSNSDQATLYTLTHNKYRHNLLKEIKLIIPHEKHAKSQLIAVLKNNYYDDTIRAEYAIVKSFLNRHFFSQSARLFACVKLNSGAIINENDYFKKFQQIFHIEDTIVHEDSTNAGKYYEIIYGHTYLFGESLRVNDHSMNVHLVKRNEEQRETAFFIGTPIILNEY